MAALRCETRVSVAIDMFAKFSIVVSDSVVRRVGAIMPAFPPVLKLKGITPPDLVSSSGWQ